LKHPEVQKAMAKAGEQALHDPEVQKKMAEVAKEKFPEFAESAASSISAWVQDPETHHKAAELASYSFAIVKDAPREVYALLQQGPRGLRTLAFFGGLASFGVSIWQLTHIGRAVKKVEPVKYAIDVYQMVFCLITILFEASPRHIEMIGCIDRLHDNLIEYCKFLTTFIGRGLFYMFQGSLWLTGFNWKQDSKSPYKWVEVLVGGYMVMIGFFNFAMHWNILPTTVVEKAREVEESAVRGAVSVARKTMTAAQSHVNKVLHKGEETKGRESMLERSKQVNFGEVELVEGPPRFEKG